jgi:hypothetical protein
VNRRPPVIERSVEPVKLFLAGLGLEYRLYLFFLRGSVEPILKV